MDALVNALNQVTTSEKGSSNGRMLHPVPGLLAVGGGPTPWQGQEHQLTNTAQSKSKVILHLWCALKDSNIY